MVGFPVVFFAVWWFGFMVLIYKSYNLFGQANPYDQ